MKARNRKAVRAVRLALVFMIGTLAAPAAFAESPGDFLVSIGATWRYLDNGSDQGTAWRATAFADGTWAQGPAELGYGDGGEATVVNCGPNAPGCASANYITTYFRKSFTVSDVSSISALELKLQRDDGAIVYLNGTQIASSNMPVPPITYISPASTAVGGSSETFLITFALSPTGLVNGTNVLAVEIHQNLATSSDISFNASLQVTSGVTLSLARAPYIQNVTPTSAVLRWRTTTASTTRVRWGLSAGSLTNTVDVAGTRTEHVVPITGLPTETKIFYSVGSTTQTLAGGDANHYLEVPPLAGQRRPIRIWVTGDHGVCAASAQGCIDAPAVRNGYTTYAGGQLADLWLMLGDNAYNSGTDTEFTNGQFNIYPTIMRNTPFWSAPGNHEFGTGGADSPTQTGPYYDSHTFPTAGEAGGVASGTEAYYSFDYGNVHVVTLDSHDTSRTAPANPTTNICPIGGGGAGAMYQWACADLAATDKDFVVAIWHHPPYTKGSHDSDSESQLIEMRQRFQPVMEAYGVDLVLTGHSHSYERSVLLDGHYGLSGTYSPGLHAVDAGDGDPAGNGAYVKSNLGTDPNTGTVSAVPGSASQISGGSLNHPVMETSLNILGSMVIDVVGRQLDARMIGVSGNVLDHFQIVKGGVLPVCSDGIDQDGDGRFDHPSDPGCASVAGTIENPECNDGLDNDADLLIDLADGDCSSASDNLEAPPPPACGDGLDNDGDTLIDFPADPGCASAGSTTESPQCNDGTDNDSDTLIDLSDPGCLGASDDDEFAIFPSCSDALDNDGDTLIDFPADPGCVDAMSNVENPQCDDGTDNDGDTLVDLADPDCADGADPIEAPACADGLDNDGDTLADFPTDPGCATANSNDESPECNDGSDNDGDTLVDLADPGCASASDDIELAVFPACSDGLDNDGDTVVDFPADPGCASAAATLENPQCNDGADNDGDTLVDLADPQCVSASHNLESMPLPACGNGVDDDGDTLIDYPADPGCLNAASVLENPACDDDLDNDGDTAIDWDGGSGMATPDPQCAVAFRNLETPNPPSGCGLGAELVIALPLLAALSRRARRR